MRTKMKRILLAIAVGAGLIAATALPASARITMNHSETLLGR